MTWFGNSLSTLKDQITTLTREVLAEADEDQEQPLFVPIEKFNRLLRICEEKDEQVCQLQLEVDTHRHVSSELKTDSKTESKEKNIDEINKQRESCVIPEGSITTSNSECPKECQWNQSQTESNSSTAIQDLDKLNEDHLLTILQRIENVKDKNRLFQLREILKEVKRLYEAEKQLKSGDGSVATSTDFKFPENEQGFHSGPRSQHGTEETMSNDSERSDDSLFNDFEVLKARGTMKSLGEFILSNTEVQGCTQSTRSTSTQSEYDFSVSNKGTQTCLDKLSEKEFREAGAVLNHSICIDRELTEDEFWNKIDDPALRKNESLNKNVIALIEENKYWKQFCQFANQDPETNTSLKEESDSLKDTNMSEYVDELSSYNKKLENFSTSLREVNSEVIDQTSELNSLHSELKSLTEAKELLQLENLELKAALEQMKENERNSKILFEKTSENSTENDNLSVSREDNEEEGTQTISKQFELLSETSLNNQTAIEREEQYYIPLISLRDDIQTLRNLMIDGSSNQESQCTSKSLIEKKLNECQNKLDMWIDNYSKLKDENTVEVEETCDVIAQCSDSERQSCTTNETEEIKAKEFEQFLHVFELTCIPVMDSLLEYDCKIEEITQAMSLNVCQLNQCLKCGQNTEEFVSQFVNSSEQFLQYVDILKELFKKEVNVKQRYKSDLHNLKSKFVSDSDSINPSLELERIRQLQNHIETLNLKLDQIESQKIRLEDEFKSKTEEVDLKSRTLESLEKEMESVVTTVENATERKNNSKRVIIKYISSLSSSHNEDSLHVCQLVFSILEEIKNYFELGPDIIEAWQCFQKTHTALKNLEIEITQREDLISELQAKIHELENSIVSQNGDVTYVNSVVSELQQKVETLTSERDQVIASLKEKHAENLYYHSEIQKIHALYTTELDKNNSNMQIINELQQKLSENQNAVTELARLRDHLLAIEQSYTNELLSAEERIKDLEKRVKEYEDRIQSLNAAQTSVNIRANQMSESLQKEVHKLSHEKDQLLSKINSSQNELKKVVNDAQNLKSALDLFHRNKDSEIFQATEKYRSDIRKLENDNQRLNEAFCTLQKNVEMMKMKSNERQQMLEEIETKKVIVKNLEKEVETLKFALNQSNTKILELEANTENKFKIDLLKNIFLRYVSSNNESMKSQALQILSEVLNLSPEEKWQLGLSSQGEQKSTSKNSSSSHSLIDEFIRFVEKESDPHEKKGYPKQQGTTNILFSSQTSLSEVMLPAPSLHPVGHNAGNILKDVLQ